MNKSNQLVQGLAEVSLRVHDFDVMRRFYEQVIGLETLKEIEENGGRAVFYGLGAGNELQNLALFEETMGGWSVHSKAPTIDPKRTTFHHVALSISLHEFESERERLKMLGVEIIRSVTSSWMKAHMFYFTDPEGNLIEYKSHDESIQ